MELAGVGIVGAFLGGIVSFLSPCVLPLVPGYISYISGDSADNRPERSLGAVGLSLLFVGGFTTVFAIMGATATGLGRLLLAWRTELGIAGGVVVAVFGLFMLGAFRPMALMRDLRVHAALRGGTLGSAYVMGLAFAFGWTPCVGPILASILTVSARSATVSEGIVLLAVYGTGLGVPFVAAALFAERLTGSFGRVAAFGRYMQLIAGAALVVMGAAMATGYLSLLAYWLLELFPALARIG